MMKAEASEKLTKFLLSVTCITAYLFLSAAMIANALDTSVYHFFLG
jgi:hypothetical protein